MRISPAIYWDTWTRLRNGYPVLLAIDVGNSHTVFGITRGIGTWDACWRVSTTPSSLGNDWAPLVTALAKRDGINLREITDVVLCSVVPSVTTALSEFAREWLR